MINERWEDRQVKHLPLPPTAQEQAEFDIFNAEFDSLIEQGESRGWIDTSGDGWWTTRPKPSGYTQREETDEEMQARLDSPFARIIWETNRQVLKQFMEQGVVLDRISTPQVPNEHGHVVFPVVHRD